MTDLSTSLAAVLAEHRPALAWTCVCGGEPGVPWADHLAAVLVESVSVLLTAAKHDAWNEGFTRGFYDVLAGGGRDACESTAANPYDRSELDA